MASKSKRKKQRARKNKKLKQTRLKKQKRQAEQIRLQNRSNKWKPENVGMRFPTEVDLIFGNLNGNYNLLSDQQRLRAERWKQNYLKSFDEMILTLLNGKEYIDSELFDILDDIRWKISESDVIEFLKGQDKYPQELSIRVNYAVSSLAENAQRIAERWSEIYA